MNSLKFVVATFMLLAFTWQQQLGGGSVMAMNPSAVALQGSQPADAITCPACDEWVMYFADWCVRPRGGLFAAACKPIMDPQKHGECVFVAKRLRNLAQAVYLTDDGCSAVDGLENKTRGHQNRLQLCCSAYVQCHNGNTGFAYHAGDNLMCVWG